MKGEIFPSESAQAFLCSQLEGYYSGSERALMSKWILEHLNVPKNITLRDLGAKSEILKRMAGELQTHKPIQYVLGEAVFMGHTFFCDARALIPRPETEEMTEMAIKELMDLQKEEPVVLDLCTGGGCIAIAIKMAFPNSRVLGLDNSVKAIELATKNSNYLRADVSFLLGNILLSETSLKIAHELKKWEVEKFDLIISNPPYITRSESAEMEKRVLDFEPHEALFVEGGDGMQFYKPLIAMASEFLGKGGALWVECNQTFSNEVLELAIAQSFIKCRIVKDLSGVGRFVAAIAR